MKVDFEKLKDQKIKREKIMQTDRFQNIAHFYHQKGLLKFAQKPKVIRNKKIDILDILWAAKYEPRFLEVFAAAYIHFPKKFTDVDKIPTKLAHIIKLIEQNEENGPDYKAIKYQDMKRWANLQLSDKRSVPLKEQKKLVSFKLDKKIANKLDELAQVMSKTKTQILEELITRA